MKERIKKIQEMIESKIEQVNDLKLLEELRISVLGKKSELNALFSDLKSLEGEQRKEIAKELNIIKANFETKLAKLKDKLWNLELANRLKHEKIDLSLYEVRGSSFGHPVQQCMNKIIDYFVNMNFSVKSGPLVEDDFHNFEALNLHKFHPARDMQDTFYFRDSKLLRTHTSPMEIRTMEQEDFPIRIIAPGSVFRRDYDVTHSPMFHQVEGLVVDEIGKISFANLKYILEDFLRYMFGDVKVRFRSSFFPFTEPSAEVDISCVFCYGEGCRICSRTGWLEVLGCGMTHDKVFANVGYKNASGYAFGLGVERFAMLIHKVNDLRSFFETDLRILEQF